MAKPKQPEFIPYEIKKWVKTHEDWAPSFPVGKNAPWLRLETPNPYKLGLVAGVTKLRAFMSDPECYRVSVWGGDDFGMIIDVESIEEAHKLYYGLPRTITEEHLKSLGFQMF